MTTRGIRNNNPGNIDRNATKWQGMAADQSGDKRFIVFTSPQYGIRALARTLLTYQSKYRLDTVRKIINRWAPPVENDTGAYVAAVAKSCGVGPDDPVDCDEISIMLPLVKAIITHENGKNPYSDALILEGLHMAGIVDAPTPVALTPPPPKPLVKQGPFMTKVGAGVAVAGSACATYAPTVKSWADQLAAFTGSPIIAHAQTALLTLAGGLLIASIVFSVMKQRAAKS
jgi:hypothetical protein